MIKEGPIFPLSLSFFRWYSREKGSLNVDAVAAKMVLRLGGSSEVVDFRSRTLQIQH